ncbi:MAG: CorA family divalent cation transporter [Polyangiaceae bacterium]
MARVIPSNWDGLPQVIVKRFGTTAGRQRSMFHEGHLVLVLHAPPRHDEVDRRAAIFWRNTTAQWRATGEAKGGLNGLKELVEAYRQRILPLEQSLESSKRAADFFRIQQEIAPLLRSIRHFHKTIQEGRELVKDDADLISLRDAAGDLERMAELVQSDAKAGLEFVVARQSEENAERAAHIERSSHRLNLIAAMFLPISALGSVFGVNLAHGLEHTASPYLFWIFVGAAFVLGLIVRSSVNRSAKR